jgi:hypothetical protein
MPEDLRPATAIATQESAGIGGLVLVKLRLHDDKLEVYDRLEVAGVRIALTPAERDALKVLLLRVAKGGR